MFSNFMLAPKIQGSEKENSLDLSNSDVDIITPENKTYSKESGNYQNSYDFEDILDFKDTYGLINELDGHKNILKISYGFSYSISNKFSQEFGTIEFYFRTEDATEKTIMALKGLETTPHIYFYVFNDDWYFLDNDTFTTIDLSGYKPSDNKWHHIRIDFETTSGGYLGLAQEMWRLNVDGHSSGQLEIFRSEISPPPCVINEIWLASYVGLPDGGSYFDAFGYSWDHYYDIGENKNQGFILNFESIIEISAMWYSLDGLADVNIPGNTTIPMPDYGTHKVQVFLNGSMGAVYQSVVEHFVIGPFNIISPIKDTVWEEGKTYEIEWITYKNITQIDIEIYKGEILKHSKYGLDNNGSYFWSIPEGISRGTDWKLKIIDSSNATHYAISEYFEVLTSIHITSPTSGSSSFTNTLI